MQHTMKVMGRSGHRTVEWETKDIRSIAKAEAEFDTLMGMNYVAYSISPTDKTDGEVIRRFDPDNDIVAAVPLVGG